jgi:hypothetical protein
MVLQARPLTMETMVLGTPPNSIQASRLSLLMLGLGDHKVVLK